MSPKAGTPRAVGRGVGGSSLLSSGGALGRDRRGLVVAGTGLLITVALFFVIDDQRSKAAHARFEKHSMELADALERHLEHPVDSLLAVPAFFEASDYVSLEEFMFFVRGPLQRHPEIYSFEWFPIVLAADRETHERSIREQGEPLYVIKELSPNGSLVPAGQRERYFPLAYEWPPHPLALGMDLLVDAERAAPPLAALATGTITASPPFTLFENPGVGAVVAVYFPVHADPLTEDEPDGEPVGLAAALVLVEGIMEDALTGSMAEGLAVVLVDDGLPPQDALFFEREIGDGDTVPTSTWIFERHVDVADRSWKLCTAPRAGAAAFTAETPWLLLLAGVVTSLGLGYAVASLATIRRLRRRVDAAAQLGQYRLERKIGEGGMGQVYEASHALLKRRTAVKLIRPERADSTTIARFEREVQLTANLTHPNTIAIYDFGRTDGGIFYYAMEYLDGLDLRTLVAEHGPLCAGRTIHVLAQICGSLAEAHRAGLIHRDVKPDNAFLTTRGGLHDVIKVLDFGLVKDVTGGDMSVTQVDVLTGTPHYMSPEAIQEPSSVDARSDIYAVGAVGYFLLTGTPPFEAGSALSVLNAHVTEVPESPTARLGQPVDGDLEALILRCLGKAPEVRHATACALRADLLACAAATSWTETKASDWWAAHPVPASRSGDATTPASKIELATVTIDLAASLPTTGERPTGSVG